MLNCPRCNSKTNHVTDIDGETLPECVLCGWRGFKTPDELGIILPKDDGNPGVQGRTDRKQKSNLMPDAQAYMKADSGCKIATLFLGCQSLCFACPFPDCKIEARQNAWLESCRRIV